MRICILNSDFKMGGQQRANVDLAENLYRNGEDVYLYSFKPGEPFYDVGNLNFVADNTPSDLKFLDKLKRKIKRKVTGRKGNSDPSREFPRRLKHFDSFLKEKKISIVIVSGGFLTSFIRNLKEKNPELIFIAWQHSNALIYLNRYYKDIKSKYIEGLAYADYVVCLTKEDKQIFADFNEKIKVIPNSLSFQSKAEPKTLEETNKTILFCSRYDIHTKGIDLLIEIIKKLPNDYNLEFAGSGSKKQTKKLLTLIDSNKLSNRVSLKGALNTDDIKNFYSKGNIFISTSRWEGFGLAIVEAMSFGNPVIAFKTSGSQEIIGDNQYGVLVDNEDTDQMVDRIKEVFTQKDLFYSLSSKSIERAAHYSRECVYLKWETLLNEIKSRG